MLCDAIDLILDADVDWEWFFACVAVQSAEIMFEAECGIVGTCLERPVSII